MLQRIPKIQIGQRQVYLFQEGGMPFGSGDGLALIVVYVPVESQAILKLHQNKQISIPRLVRYYRCYPRRCFYCYGVYLTVLIVAPLASNHA